MNNPETRPAASTFLYRRNKNNNVEIYLARRSEKTSFFPGYYAFLGGTLEKEDREQEDQKFRHCAIRELFEETGVLLCEGKIPDSADLHQWRTDLLRENTTFIDLLSEHRLSPDYDRLRPAGRLLTPNFVPVRYDTRFYASPLPDEQEIDIRKGELTEGEWFGPEKALEKWAEGQVQISPPQILYLRILVENGFEEGLEELQTINTAEPDQREPYIELRPGLRFQPLETPTLPPAETVNTCIVGHDPLVVVDPGTPLQKERQHLADHIDRELASGGTFEHLLLTHHHPDHSAAAGWLKNRYDVRLCAHENAGEHFDDDLRVERKLVEGDQVPTSSGPLTVLHTPGHTRDHLCFLHEQTRTLLAGDVIAGMGMVLIDPPDGDMAMYMNTLRRLRDMDLDLLLPAHGPFNHHPKKVFDRYIQHRMKREEKVTSALSPDRTRTVEDLLPEVYSDVDEGLWTYAKRSLLAHLIKLRDEDRARKKEGGWIKMNRNGK